MLDETKQSTDLDALVRELDGWRRRHGGRGRRIPEELWLEAAEAARSLGVNVVARELRLRRGHLENRVACLDEVATEGGVHAAFVEVPLPAVWPSAAPRDRGDCAAVVMWLEASDGRRLRLEVPPATPCSVDAIFAAFREVTP